jgi:hypothetical protein
LTDYLVIVSLKNIAFISTNIKMKTKIMLITLFIIWAFQLAGKSSDTVNGEDFPTTQTLIKTKEGVSLYERWIHSTSYKTREIMLEFTVDAHYHQVLDLIKDGSKVKNWNKQVKSFEILEPNSSEWVSYILYAIPWPFESQDCVLRNSVQELNSGAIVNFYSISHPSKPIFDNIERLENVHGTWEIIKKENDKSLVRYTVSMKPSKVPNWLTDPFVRKSFLDSMISLIQILESTEATSKK